MHVLPGCALGTVTALQVQDDLLDSRLDGSEETTLPRRYHGEAAGVTAGEADHPLDRRAGPLRWNRVPSRTGKPSCCLARLGKSGEHTRHLAWHRSCFGHPG